MIVSNMIKRGNLVHLSFALLLIVHNTLATTGSVLSWLRDDDEARTEATPILGYKPILQVHKYNGVQIQPANGGPPLLFNAPAPLPTDQITAGYDQQVINMLYKAAPFLSDVDTIQSVEIGPVLQPYIQSISIETIDRFRNQLESEGEARIGLQAKIRLLKFLEHIKEAKLKTIKAVYERKKELIHDALNFLRPAPPPPPPPPAPQPTSIHFHPPPPSTHGDMIIVPAGPNVFALPPPPLPTPVFVPQPLSAPVFVPQPLRAPVFVPPRLSAPVFVPQPLRAPVFVPPPLRAPVVVPPPLSAPVFIPPPLRAPLFAPPPLPASLFVPPSLPTSVFVSPPSLHSLPAPPPPPPARIPPFSFIPHPTSTRELHENVFQAAEKKDPSESHHMCNCGHAHGQFATEHSHGPNEFFLPAPSPSPATPLHEESFLHHGHRHAHSRPHPHRPQLFEDSLSLSDAHDLMQTAASENEEENVSALPVNTAVPIEPERVEESSSTGTVQPRTDAPSTSTTPVSIVTAALESAQSTESNLQSTSTNTTTIEASRTQQ